MTCSEDNKTITFNLVRPIGDFNYATALLAFSPVPEAADTGAQYDLKPLSNGPYKIEDYTIGKSLTLVRNDQYDPATDTLRPANPDKIVVTFGIEPPVSTQRLIADSGVDQQSMTLGDAIDPAQLATVFNDPNTRGPALRRVRRLRALRGRQHGEGAEPQAPSGPRRGVPARGPADHRWGQLRRRPRRRPDQAQPRR